MVMLSQVFFTKGFSLEGHRTSCSFEYLSRDFNSRFWLFFMVSIGYVLPMFVITTAYVGLFYIVKYNRTQNNLFKLRQSVCSATKNNEDFLNKSFSNVLIRSKMKLVRVITTQIALFNMAWIPYVCLVMVAQFGNESSMHELVTPFTVLIANFASKLFVLMINIYIANLNYNSILVEEKKIEKKRVTISCIERNARSVTIFPDNRKFISMY